MRTRAAIMETSLGSCRWRQPLLIAAPFCCLLLTAPWAPADEGAAKGPQPGAAAAQPRAAIVSLRVVPERVTIWGARASQHFLVLGTLADGLERDLTSRSRLSLSDPRLAALEQGGRIMAL